MADLTELARIHMEAALATEHGRSAELILRDGPLRQSIIALDDSVFLLTTVTGIGVTGGPERAR